MILAAKLGMIPVIVIIAVAMVFLVWLLRFISGIRKTRDFYKQQILKRNEEAHAVIRPRQEKTGEKALPSSDNINNDERKEVDTK